MSQEALQEYFNEHSVRYLEKGSQVQVYGDKRLVIKRVKSSRSGIIGFITKFEPANSPHDLMGKIQEYEAAMAKKMRETWERGKNTLGGLVVPYETPDAIRATVRGRLLRIFSHDCTFHSPMVQERQSKDHFLRAQLEKAVKAGDIEKIDLILREVMEHYANLIFAGAFPHDPLPDNCVWTDEEKVLTSDIAGLTLTKRVVTTAVNRPEMAEISQGNLQVWEHALGKTRQDPDLSETIEKFEKKFLKMYDPRFIGKNFGKRTNHRRVPDLQI